MIYEWNTGSALYQAEHGEPRTDRTRSAFRYLENALLTGSEDTCRTIALDLLAAFEDAMNHGKPS